MKTVEQLRAYFKADRFAALCDITIDSVCETGAVCSVRLRDDHKNAMGGAQGGLIYTLADLAFAVAANAFDFHVVTLNAAIHYLAPGKGDRLVAEANACHSGNRTCVYEVTVTDDQDNRVAFATFTGYLKRK